MVVLEGELVFTLLGHLQPNSCLTDTFTVYLVGLQEVLPGIAVETADAEVLPTPVHVLFVEKLGPCPSVMETVGFPYQEKVNAGHIWQRSCRLLAERFFAILERLKPVLTLFFGSRSRIERCQFVSCWVLPV